MRRNLQKPIIYLVTSGATNPRTNPANQEFLQLLKLIDAAVSAGVNLVQIREKELTGRVLFQLAAAASEITRGSDTRLLVNDRADIAVAAGADGVHLTTRSLSAGVVRRTFGNELLIGVSTHSLAEAVTASEQEADFIVFGPVFETPSKGGFGEPVGLQELERLTASVPGSPVVALGGVNIETIGACFQAGAQGVAAIRMFSDPAQLRQTVATIRIEFSE